MLQIRETYVMGLGLLGSVNYAEWTAGPYFGINRMVRRDTTLNAFSVGRKTFFSYSIIIE